MSKRLTIDVVEVLRLTNARMVSHGFAPVRWFRVHAGFGYIGAEGEPSPTPVRTPIIGAWISPNVLAWLTQNGFAALDVLSDFIEEKASGL